ncbi:MAG: EamA family transporter [Candidatus Lokiarchaeota archaeon]|nr:EamA family transporter [Candidatus Lokiarchaeota archaeon]
MMIIYLLLVLMIGIWSFSFVLVDITFEFMLPLSVVLYRFVIASITYLIIDFCLFTKRKCSKEIIEKSPKYSKNDWIMIILSSLFGVSLFFLAQYVSIELIGPSLPALFVCLLSPVFISLLALFLFKEKLSKKKIFGFAIASVGAFFLVTGGNIQNLTPESPNFLGYFLALLTPFQWALYSSFTKKVSSNNSKMKLNKYISYLGVLEVFIIMLLTNQFTDFIENIINPVAFLTAIYLGIGCYVLGYYIWQKAQSQLKSFKVASFLYIEPFLTLLFSMLLQRTETIVLWNVIGGLIVLGAVLLINYK